MTARVKTNLKHKLGELRRRLLGDDFRDPNIGRDILIKKEDAQAYLQVKRTWFFQIPFQEALDEGYQFTTRSIFEATDWAVAKDTAEILQEIKQHATVAQTDRSTVIDAFAGTGQNTWAFAEAGFPVIAFEIHKLTYTCLKQNLAKVQANTPATQIEVRNADSVMFLKSSSEQPSVLAVYLDPPWNGKNKYDLVKPFRLKDTDPPADKLIELSLKKAPIAILKAPSSIDLPVVKNLAKQLEVNVLMSKVNDFNLTTLYFIKDEFVDLHSVFERKPLIQVVHLKKKSASTPMTHPCPYPTLT